jgi:hypothetical protein
MSGEARPTKDPPAREPILGRWRRLLLPRAERSARRIVADLVAQAPRDLAELERVVGRLDVEMDGPEGRGGGVFRPESPFAPGGMTGGRRRGRLRPGLVRVFVAFDWDPYHGHPRTPAGLRPNHLSVSVDLGRDEVRRALERALGPARAIHRDGGEVLEYGEWYYLERWERPSSLAWQRRRPDWAVPPVAAGDADAFLAALVEALVRESDPDAVAALVATLAPPAGAAVSVFDGRLTVSARPGFTVPAMAEALDWPDPVAWSTDVHMSSWRVGQRDGGHGGPGRTRIGPWLVEAYLAGLPSDAPRLDTRGPSFVYDMRGHPGPVATIIAAPREGRAGVPGGPAVVGSRSISARPGPARPRP